MSCYRSHPDFSGWLLSYLKSLSSTHIAFGSIRMEPVFMITGQSAATAAVLAIEHKKSLQDLDYSLLQQYLLRDGQVLRLP